ncbi:hypothetical protein NLI96_g8076 [Meripilus lineatus]|uniref:Uncharacterized protein n=1 Tax=Meripilus lineatus TaxID=2056292 RepID=A0AAD5UY12_9APHY|nr:hypothetical protein NLI96_g8076 [Physisporinus lineatus]
MLLKKMTDRLTANRAARSTEQHPHSSSSTPLHPGDTANTPMSSAPEPSSASSHSVSMSMSISSSKDASSLSTAPSSHLMRGSISTQRTSVSDWSKKQEAMEVYEIPQALQLQAAKKPRGSYRLDDFKIHRTLGTGSFGRVHLGEFRGLFQLSPDFLLFARMVSTNDAFVYPVSYTGLLRDQEHPNRILSYLIFRGIVNPVSLYRGISLSFSLTFSVILLLFTPSSNHRARDHHSVSPGCSIYVFIPNLSSMSQATHVGPSVSFPFGG